ncbi:hypothetical protein Tco_0963046, partial [Tanacetum coccineum]
MSYPRFTKIIIDYFMIKDQSISRRNKMFWHTDRDDTMFTSMRYEGTGTIPEVPDVPTYKYESEKEYWGDSDEEDDDEDEFNDD